MFCLVSWEVEVEFWLQSYCIGNAADEIHSEPLEKIGDDLKGDKSIKVAKQPKPMYKWRY